MSDLSWLNPTPHAIAVYASQSLSPVATQHSLPSGRYSLTWAGLPPAGSHQLAAGALIQSPRRRARAVTDRFAVRLLRYPITAAGALFSLRLDIRLADDLAVFVILLAEKGGEICAARPDRKEPLADKLRLELGRLHRRGKPTGKLGGRFLRRLRRRKQPKPIVYFVVLIA